MKVKILLFCILLGSVKISSCRFISENDSDSVQSGDTISWNSVKVNRYGEQVFPTDHNEAIQEFYEKRDYRLAWFSNGRLSANAYQLLDELRSSDHLGLDAENYDLFKVYGDSLLTNPDKGFLRYSPSDAARFDLLLSQTFLDYASDLSGGRITTDSLPITWESYPERTDLALLLDQALEENSVTGTLYELRPHHNTYYSLIDAYHNLAMSPWDVPGQIPVLKKGAKSNSVPRLKQYLQDTGDLENSDSVYLSSPLFDAELEKAVIDFQERHGLDADGITGEMTSDVMNVPYRYRLDQVLVNIDRIRSRPNHMGIRYIIVNIPGFFLEYFDRDSLRMKMDVVVGELENYTPILKDTMSYIVFNPTWNVPFSIATEEMLPEIKKDPDYLIRNDYILLKGSYSSNDTLDPETIKWRKITPEEFPFSIVQQPGKKNALGRIKFMFPNNYAIYLHDTPADHMFEYEKRDFSHGCIRLEKPVELAQILLEGQLTPEEIEEMLTSEDTSEVPIDQKVTVHFTYQTAWVDGEGRLQFRDDIYEIDRESISLLNVR